MTCLYCGILPTPEENGASQHRSQRTQPSLPSASSLWLSCSLPPCSCRCGGLYSQIVSQFCQLCAHSNEKKLVQSCFQEAPGPQVSFRGGTHRWWAQWWLPFQGHGYYRASVRGNTSSHLARLPLNTRCSVSRVSQCSLNSAL